MTRVIFHNPGHDGWEQEHELRGWPAREATVELWDHNSARTFGVARVVWVLNEDQSPPHVRIELHPARTSAS